MSIKTSIEDVSGYITRDGSEIRELLHPAQQPMAANQSLAEARLTPGQKTLRHRHHQTEEIYHILSGEGLMHWNEERFTVTTGDSVLIPPGTAHCIENTSEQMLRLLCCCAPAYRHDDTELLE